MPSPRQTLKNLGLAPTRRRGQNFLRDQEIAKRLAAATVAFGEGPILEIGPGLGALTRPLLDLGAKVTAVELDRGLAAALDKWPEVQEGRLKVINEDVLKLNLRDLGAAPYVVVGNLPYNLSSPILFWFLRQGESLKAGVFALQKEMAQSLLAKPGEERYGRLSVALSLWAKVSPILEIPPSAFQPKPKVQSAAVALVPQKGPNLALKSLETFTAKVFRARRKTLANNLIAAYGPLKTQSLLAAFNLDPLIRAEKLEPSLLAQMAKLLEEGA
ncbi:MAG: 16S rRNA (adenine(1518)-N(6)/adenine(1519)-N(6))-dimethyltransferase RsmA [Deltaproteobacteria bacterium]|jgi:16S rRNA (adenine1518-N6/adenine1519-N6)-dimethyltransferase|nr:16S rRNA (adenine(1518)-N(6)/adenine(1519)-N(6))-dimethyltransferase RsmA [Deltaproteobacteria bacterium]